MAEQIVQFFFSLRNFQMAPCEAILNVSIRSRIPVVCEIQLKKEDIWDTSYLLPINSVFYTPWLTFGSATDGFVWNVHITIGSTYIR